MRRGWKFRLLAIMMLAIVWILIVPTADLDPATPPNLEGFFFLVVAICVVLAGRGFFHELLRSFSIPLCGLPPKYLAQMASQVAPLRC